MAIKNGDFVKLEFTGKFKENGDVFDTTNEEIAKESGIFVEDKEYGPLPIVVGGNHLLKAMDEAIIGMDIGESKEVEVSPEGGFGKRDSNLIKLIPMKEFKKQGMNPHVGMEITSEGHKGKILNITGGRVRVDFNHKLAGKTLVYSMVISDIIKEDEEKIKSMIQLHYAYPGMDLDKTEIKINGDKVSIKLDEVARFDHKSYMDITMIRFKIAQDIWGNMDFEKVEFIDEFVKSIDEGEEITEDQSSDNKDNEE